MLLTEDQMDVLKELFNRGIGKSAEIISAMLDAPLSLSVPTLRLQSIHELGESFSSEDVIGIRQIFDGKYRGDAMVLYGRTSCLEVISALLGYEETPDDFGDLERETLSEFGNIILSSCLFEFEEALGCHLPTLAPAIVHGDFPDCFISKEHGNHLMTLTMEFSVSGSASTGHITLLLDPDDIADMASKMDAYLERLMA
ncbi:MAG: hypothetical protein H6618_03050 [Deltaproteobacteria bacterium]|nr:hypothetical protein [Deltaproteobacteria bacterium]